MANSEDEAPRERQKTQGALRATPWIAARPAGDPLLPNGCPTCADSKARFTPEAMRANQTPLTAGGAKNIILRRYPAYVHDGPITTFVRSPAAIERQCGRNVVGCARLALPLVTLPPDAEPSLVVHETLHTMTSPRWAARAPRTVNEAMTEYFTRRLGYYHVEGGVLPKAYEGGQRLINDYVAGNPAREDALARAYFAGDFGPLEALEDPRPRDGEDSLVDRRFGEWDDALVNQLRGSSVAVDDEELVPGRPGAVDTALARERRFRRLHPEPMEIDEH